jgi:hypothetical protein
VDELGSIALLIATIGLKILAIYLAWRIWTRKGGSGMVGFLLGFFLSWVGVLIVALMTPRADPFSHPPRTKVSESRSQRLLG